MFELILGFMIGLIVGWNFIKQPEWVAEKVAKITEKVKSTFNGE